MATLVQQFSGLALTSDPASKSLAGVTADNYLYLLVSIVGSATVVGVTDDDSNSYSALATYSAPGGRLEVWRALLTQSGTLNVDVDISAIPPGGGGVVFAEVQHAGTPTTGPSNTLDATTAADPFVMAPLTTTNGGILFTVARMTTNFSFVSFGDGFAQLQIGAALGRGLFAYRITSSAVSAAPTADMAVAESGDSLTLAIYDATEIRGSFGFGSDLSVTATKAIAFSVDGNSNTHSTSGEVKVFGDFEVTGDTEVVNLTATGTTTLANNSISYAEMQDVSAASRLLGRGSAAGSGDPQEISLGSGLTMSGTTLSASSGITTRTITFVLDGDGSVLTTGVKKASVRLPFAATITGWTLMADQSGNIELDVLRDTFANYPPTGADSIVNAHYPALSSADSAEDTDLSDWSDVTMDAGDVLKIDVRSVSTLTYAVLRLTVTA